MIASVSAVCDLDLVVIGGLGGEAGLIGAAAWLHE
jgi:hypothetical protein